MLIGGVQSVAWVGSAGLVSLLVIFGRDRNCGLSNFEKNPLQYMAVQAESDNRAGGIICLFYCRDTDVILQVVSSRVLAI